MANEGLRLSGRAAEIDILRRLVASPRSELLALYGRRRVGKTFLVRRFFADQPITYFEVVGRFEGDRAQQLEIFAEAVGRAFYDGAPVAVPDTWHAAFRLLERAIEARAAAGKKLVLFFDELPWIDTPRSGCLRELEHFWNAWCSRRDDVLLIVCGSAAAWMLRNVVDARGGLHNRLTQTIRLQPFDLSEVSAFFRDRNITFSTRDLIELYMVIGGVPHYLDRVRRGLSVSQIVDDVMLSKDGALRREYARLFASLFEHDDKYDLVVRALAKRRAGLSRQELIAETGLPSGGGLTTILRNLEEAGFTSTVVPHGRTLRDTVVRLTDPFVLFHLFWLDRRPPKRWQLARSSPRGHAWAGLAFENVCLQHVSAIERALGISGIESEASAWRSPDAQVDLLISRADRVLSMCEMKFTDAPFVIDKRYAEDLRNKVAALREAFGSRRTVQIVFVTTFGVKQNVYSQELVDRVVTIDDLLR